jgi:hypothetical protein
MIADRRTAPLLALGAALAACAPPGADSGFVDGPAVAFVHDNGATGSYHFPETMGSGVALLDADDDGRTDVYFVQGGALPGLARAAARPANALLLGDGRGGFTEAGARAGDAAHTGFGMGVSVADVNGDGLDDLFLTNVGPDALCLGTADPSKLFVDATPPTLRDPRWTTASAFADLDRDGHLDLGTVGYVDWSAASEPDCAGGPVRDYCSVELYPGLTDRLYIGDGRGGFIDVSSDWGFDRVAARGLGLAFVDLDEDGLVDAYVANDTDANRLYLNQGGQRFVDVTDRSGASASADGAHEAGMGVAVGDVDADGSPDLIVTNFAAEANSVYVNRGGGDFRERSRPLGVATPSMSRLAFGVQWFDADLDGRDDLFFACGHVLRHVDATGSTFTWRQPDQLLLADDAGRFVPHPGGPALTAARAGRGSASGDLDGDLRPDLVVSNSASAPTIALNRFAGDDTHPLAVSLESTRGSNRFAIGARITVQLEDGRALRRWVRAGTGYLSQDERRQLFSIPSGVEPRSVEVLWPDGESSEHFPARGELELHLRQEP